MSVNIKNEGKDEFCSKSQRIKESLSSNIFLDLEGKGLGDWFSLHVNVVVYTAFTDVLEFVLLGKALDTSKWQEIYAFNFKNEIKSRYGIVDCIKVGIACHSSFSTAIHLIHTLKLSALISGVYIGSWHPKSPHLLGFISKMLFSLLFLEGFKLLLISEISLHHLRLSECSKAIT